MDGKNKNTEKPEWWDDANDFDRKTTKDYDENLDLVYSSDEWD